MATRYAKPSGRSARPSLVQELVHGFREFARAPFAVGSAFPASHWMTETLLAPVDWSRIRRVIELGPGTGRLTRALGLNPTAVNALTTLARISDIERATELIDDAFEREPEEPLVLLARGRLPHRLLSDRLADVREAVNRVPDLAEGTLELAKLEARVGDAEAVESLLVHALFALNDRMELIPQFVDSAIDIAHHGMAAIVEAVLTRPEGTALEPLLIALRIERGDNPVVAKEVRDVATDIVESMRRYREIGEDGRVFGVLD